MDIPEPTIPSNVKRDEWTYVPPDRDYADVQEVWFAGCHADVGGGSHSTRRNRSLSSIPLRWMIKECILAKTGIQFDLEYLKESVDFDFNGLLEEMGEKGVEVEDLGVGYEGLRGYADEVPPSIVVESANGGSVQTCYARANGYPPDRCDNIFDQLILVWLWWLIEFIPTLFTYQDAGGNWVRLRLYVKLSRDFSKSLTYSLGVILAEGGTYRSTKTRFGFMSLWKNGCERWNTRRKLIIGSRSPQ